MRQIRLVLFCTPNAKSYVILFIVYDVCFCLENTICIAHFVYFNCNLEGNVRETHTETNVRGGRIFDHHIHLVSKIPGGLLDAQ